MKRLICLPQAAPRWPIWQASIRSAAIRDHPNLAQTILAEQSWRQALIASQWQIPQGTVARDVTAVCKFWREFTVCDFDNVRAESLQKKVRQRKRLSVPATPSKNPDRVLASADAAWFAFARRTLPLNYARSCHFYAHQGPLCAYARIIAGLYISPSYVRAFSDFPAYAGEDMTFEKPCERTAQVIARQAEAAVSDGSPRCCRRSKICA